MGRTGLRPGDGPSPRGGKRPGEGPGQRDQVPRRSARGGSAGVPSAVRAGLVHQQPRPAGCGRHGLRPQDVPAPGTGQPRGGAAPPAHRRGEQTHAALRRRLRPPRHRRPHRPSAGPGLRVLPLATAWTCRSARTCGACGTGRRGRGTPARGAGARAPPGGTADGGGRVPARFPHPPRRAAARRTDAAYREAAPQPAPRCGCPDRPGPPGGARRTPPWPWSAGRAGCGAWRTHGGPMPRSCRWSRRPTPGFRCSQPPRCWPAR